MTTTSPTHTDPTNVYWRSQYTGRYNAQSLGSAKIAANFAAALQRSGHTIITQQEYDDHNAPILSDDVEAVTEPTFFEQLHEVDAVVADANETVADGLSDLSITALRKINGAEKLGIVGSWELKKPALIEAIRIARAAK